MSSIKASDLIQAKALGCLDTEDDAVITQLMEDDQNFPWQELGHYQNLVAFLPTLLDIESPDLEVKNRVARKLSQLGERQKKTEQVKSPEVSVATEKISDDELIEQTSSLNRDLQLDDEVIEGEGRIKKGISFKEHGMPQIPLKEEEEKFTKDAAELQPDRIGNRTAPRVTRKEVDKKSVRSYVSKFPAEEKVIESKKDRSGIITAIILFVISLIVLIFIYFKLSSDIQDNKNEIERLKQQISLSGDYDNLIYHRLSKIT